MHVKRSVAVALVGAGLMAYLADTAIAMRAEHALSTHAAQLSDLSTAPAAYVGGLPFRSTIPRISLDALDVPVASVGVGNAGIELVDVKLTHPRTLTITDDLPGAKASLVRRSVRLDGVAFGQLLGMTDLDIASPYDISPSGGGASEARLTGTLPGADQPVTVVVTLRLEGPEFVMRPSELLDVPPELVDQAIAAFTLRRNTADLPLGGPADQVQLTGGSIEFSRDRINTYVEESDLTPLAHDAADESARQEAKDSPLASDAYEAAEN